MSDEGRHEPGVCQWINFLASHHTQFRIIHELFPKLNPGRQGMKDQRCIQTSPEEMLVIANQLFILRSYGVEGCVLECGCFKGYSSCCLSIACRYLGYPLVIADSFAGLPMVPNEVGSDKYYQAGDFSSARVEMEQNLRTFGDPSGVEVLEGWFSDILEGWNRPLAALG
jgi:O-methyltransferase